MKNIVLDDIEYELIKNEKDSFIYDDIKNLFTDYFYDYDYVVGDYAYSKLRLKGFYDTSNKKAKYLNNINGLDDYIKKQCAYNCGYYVLKKKVEISK